MAHFAELDQNNNVLRVIVVNDLDCIDKNGDESEVLGVAFCLNTFGGGTWKQTSYNGTIRKNYAGIGYYYEAELDAFIPPRPSSEHTLNVDTCQWEILA